MRKINIFWNPILEADERPAGEEALSEPANHSSPNVADFAAEYVEPNHPVEDYKPMSP